MEYLIFEISLSLLRPYVKNNYIKSFHVRNLFIAQIFYCIITFFLNKLVLILARLLRNINFLKRILNNYFFCFFCLFSLVIFWVHWWYLLFVKWEYMLRFWNHFIPHLILIFLIIVCLISALWSFEFILLFVIIIGIFYNILLLSIIFKISLVSRL